MLIQKSADKESSCKGVKNIKLLIEPIVQVPDDQDFN